MEWPKDPANPRNFSKGRKWSILGFVSLMSFLSPLTSSIFTPGVQFMNASFHNESNVLSSLVVSIYLLGYVFCPLVLSPLSEIYCRRPVPFTANSIFVHLADRLCQSTKLGSPHYLPVPGCPIAGVFFISAGQLEMGMSNDFILLSYEDTKELASILGITEQFNFSELIGKAGLVSIAEEIKDDHGKPQFVDLISRMLRWSPED
ncbi:hypothetical protein AFLA_005333 [Aspergillus flavus NRRL3357]|nr:hypothetical protein AFLA_005333 [Aspergillus flavus NRRL3357]